MEESKNNNKLIIWIAVLLIAVGASVAIFALSSGDDNTTTPATSETQGTSETVGQPEPEIDPDDGDLDTLIATGQELAAELDQITASCESLALNQETEDGVTPADIDGYRQDIIDATSYRTASSAPPLSEEIATQLAELNTLVQSIESKLSSLVELSSSCL